MREQARRRDDLPGQVNPDVRALPQARAPAFAERADPLRRRHAAELDVRREAHAEVAALGARGLLLLPEAGVVHELERAVQRLLVVAGVVAEAVQDAGV